MTFIENIALVGWMDGWMNWRIFGNASKDDDDSDDKIINALLNCVASNLYATDRDIVTVIPVIIYARDCLTQLFTSLPFRMSQTCILKLCNLHLYFIFVFFVQHFFYVYRQINRKRRRKKKHIKHQP